MLGIRESLAGVGAEREAFDSVLGSMISRGIAGT